MVLLITGFDGMAQMPELHTDELKATVNLHQYHDPFAFSVKYDEAPHPSGKKFLREYLRRQKLEAQRQFPVRSTDHVQQRGSLEDPVILASFTGNNVITSTPLDNHLAVGPDEQVVSVINVHMLVASNTGFWLGNYNLVDFFSAVGSNNIFFDPRVIYDPEQDRFIMALINGNYCSTSQIVLAFSQTSDPRGNWNLYAIDGCPDQNTTFADYPMIAITKNELFLTYNAVHSDSTWQAGFFGTHIHQIDKMSGYNGETLNRRVWKNVSYQDKLIRNICPVRNAGESLPESMYLLSTRNFDITNDTVFLLQVTGTLDDPDTRLEIKPFKMNQPYGVPPYAVQPIDSLDTNDARVLDAFELNGRIQYVHNTMNFESGRSAVYHGTLYVDEPSQTGEGNIVAHPEDYLGYPGIAWTGNNALEHDAMIIVSHVSPDRNPGGSVIYTDGFGNYSDFVTVIEGIRPIDMLTGPIERWGDYIGIQRHYTQPGSVWISCSYGRFSNRNEGWIAKIARTEGSVSTEDREKTDTRITTYPNPADDYVHIEMDNPEGKNYAIVLFDVNGKPVKTLFEGPALYPGKARATFAIHTLPPGQYYVQVSVAGKTITTKPVIKS